MSETIVIMILTWESVKKGNDDEHCSSSVWPMSPARWWFNLKAYLLCPVHLFLQVSLRFDPVLSPVNLFLLLPQASYQWLCLSFTPGDKLFHKKSWLDTIIVLARCKNDGSDINLNLLHQCELLSNLLLIRVNRQGCMSVSKLGSKSTTSWRSMLI